MLDCALLAIPAGMAASSKQATASTHSPTSTRSIWTSSIASAASVKTRCWCWRLVVSPSSGLWADGSTTFLYSDAAEWHGSDSENDDDSDSDEEGSQSGDSGNEMDEEDDGQAPVEVEPMQVEIDELVLTEAELAAKKAEKARLEVRVLVSLGTQATAVPPAYSD